MKHLKYYINYNESIIDTTRRFLDPIRKKNDQMALEVFDQMKADFIKHDSDLKKVNIINYEDGDVRFDYLFNKWHPIKNSHFSGNSNLNHSYKKIELFLYKDDKEAFLKINEYNEENEDGKKIQISLDIVKKIIKHFKDLYESKYPSLKGSVYYNSMAIQDIEKKISPTQKYISGVDVNNKAWTFKLRVGENEKDIRNFLKNKTIDEIDLISKERHEEDYYEYNKKENFYKKIIIDEIIEELKLKEIGINIANVDVRDYYDYSIVSFVIGNDEVEKTVSHLENVKKNFKLQGFIYIASEIKKLSYAINRYLVNIKLEQDVNIKPDVKKVAKYSNEYLPVDKNIDFFDE